MTPRSKDKYQVMPEPRPEEYAALKDDILERGIQNPIIFDAQGSILDGHTRMRAYNELIAAGYRLPPYPRTIREDLTDDAEKRTAARRENTQRRHLTSYQKSDIVKDQLKDTPGVSNAQIGRWLGVSAGMVSARRRTMEARGEIPFVEMLEDKNGVKYPRQIAKEEVARRVERREEYVRRMNERSRIASRYASGERLVEMLASGEVAADVKLPSAQLTKAQEAFYSVALYFLPLAENDPEAVADAASDRSEAQRALEDANAVIEWFGRYRESLKGKAQGKLRAV